jgi:hypothetical protein
VQRLVEAGDIWVTLGIFWRPSIDLSFFAHDHKTWDTVPSLLEQCKWFDSLTVRKTAFKGTPCFSVAQALAPQTFHAHMLSTGLSEKAASRVLITYHITPTLDQNLFVDAVTRWLGDIVFDAPVHTPCNYLATHTNNKVYKFIFDAGNQFIGAPFYGVPHHSLNVYFLFRTLQLRFHTQKFKDMSDAHSLQMREHPGSTDMLCCGEVQVATW